MWDEQRPQYFTGFISHETLIKAAVLWKTSVRYEFEAAWRTMVQGEIKENSLRVVPPQKWESKHGPRGEYLSEAAGEESLVRFQI